MFANGSRIGDRSPMLRLRQGYIAYTLLAVVIYKDFYTGHHVEFYCKQKGIINLF